MSTGWWEFIGAEMTARNWTMAEFSRRTEVDQSLVSNWKVKGFQPTIETLRKIAAGTGIPMLRLLVESGHIDDAEAGGAVPTPPEIPALDVVAAVKADPDLLPEAKEHLVHQYGLLLRIQSQSGKGDSRTNDGPGLRAVAQKRGDRQRERNN